MKKYFSMIITIFGWLIFTILFACLGLGSDKPSLMVPLYAVFFLIVCVVCLLILKKQRKILFEIMKGTAKTEKPKYWVNYLLGSLATIGALIFPIYSFHNFRQGLISHVIVFLFTILLLVLGFFGVFCINVMVKKDKSFNLIGYVILIITSAIPSFAIAKIDASFGTMGVIYFTMVITLLLAWVGFVLINKAYKKNE
jgi:membrane protein CcdC involved in cytochrome C biogenesis